MSEKFQGIILISLRELLDVVQIIIISQDEARAEQPQHADLNGLRALNPLPKGQCSTQFD